MRCQLWLIAITIPAWVTVHAQSPHHDTWADEVDRVLTREDESLVLGLEQWGELNDGGLPVISLGSASVESLLQVPGMTLSIAQRIVRHRAESGPLQDLYELQVIEGMTMELWTGIQRMCRLGWSPLAHRFRPSAIWKNGSHEVLLRYQQRLEPQAGYQAESGKAPYYLGSPMKVLSRYRFRVGRYISLGVTGEKDAGEAFGGPERPVGFDFTSAHLFVQELGIVKQLVLGDFHAQFGQGLTHWTGNAYGFTSVAQGTLRNARGLSPYASVDEFNFMRGAGVTLEKGRWSGSLFSSRKRVDAQLEGNGDSALITSLPTSGIHATLNQMDARKAVTEWNSGGHVQYRWPARLEVGLTTSLTGWSRAMETDPSSGSSRLNNRDPIGATGLDYKVQFRNLMLFGETTVLWSGGQGTLNGCLVSFGSRVGMSAHHRYYSMAFNPAMANPRSYGTRPEAEQAVEVVMEAKLHHSLKFVGVAEGVGFNWLRYQVDAPSTAWNQRWNLEWKPSRGMRLVASWRQEIKPRNVSAEQPLKRIGETTRHRARLHAEWSVNKRLELRTRLELVSGQNADSSLLGGWMCYQDVLWTVPELKGFTMRFRAALFETDGYESRIYAYEHDVRYAFSVPAMQGSGMRWYLVARIKPVRRNTLELKFAQTFYRETTELGQGGEQSSGPTRTDLKIQWQIVF